MCQHMPAMFQGISRLAARSYRFWGPAARSYRFWGPLGTIWDLWGPSGDHLGTIIRRSYRFLVIFHQDISFSAKTALFKFRVSFITRISIETAHQSKQLEKKKSNIHVFKKFPILISRKKVSHINPNINPNIPNKIY